MNRAEVAAPAAGIVSSALPAGPSGSPLRIAYRWYREPLAYLEELSARYGDPFTMRLPGFPPLVVFKNPDVVKQVFQDDGDVFKAGEFYRALKPFLGDHSILMLDGVPHRRERKLLLPPFNGERMHAYGDMMIRLTDDLVDRWPLNEEFSFHAAMQNLALRVTARALFGVTDDSRFDRLVATLTRLTEQASWTPLMLPFMQVDLGPLSPWGRFKRTRAQVYEMLQYEIDERRRNGERREDILSLLLDARDEEGQPMTDVELRGELMTLLFAGHETTAASLAWALRWIVGHPKVEARLKEELAAAMAAHGVLSPSVIAKLEYLDAVVRESLRYIPAAPMVGRVLSRPTVVGGYTLPEGCAVACSIYLAQRRPEVYPNPSQYSPERFVGSKFSPQEFFPFGGGVRRCIGMFFALYEMRMVLATILSRARFSLARSNIRVVREITLRPSEGLPVRLLSRDAATAGPRSGSLSRAPSPPP